jgi:hypothetical protein
MGQSYNTSSFKSQDREIENLLRSRYAEWIPCYKVQEPAGRRILQYGRAINSIRKRLRKAGDRERIQNKTERVNGQCRGFYRIVRTVDAIGIAPAKPQPGKSWEQVCAERDAKKSQSQAFELVP